MASSDDSIELSLKPRKIPIKRKNGKDQRKTLARNSGEGKFKLTQYYF